MIDGERLPTVPDYPAIARAVESHMLRQIAICGGAVLISRHGFTVAVLAGGDELLCLARLARLVRRGALVETGSSPTSRALQLTALGKQLAGLAPTLDVWSIRKAAAGPDKYPGEGSRRRFPRDPQWWS